MQIFKNSEAQEIIVSSVQTEPHGSVSRHNLAESGLTVSYLCNTISPRIVGV